MRVIWVIAFNTFRELIRDRILYGLLIFAVLLIGVSLALGQLSYAEQARISLDFGFSAINLCAVILAIFLGSSLVAKEIELRTIYSLLARPIGRVQFMFGKFLGLLGIILAVSVGLSVVLSIVIYFLGNPWDFDCFAAFFGILLEAIVMLSVTMLFGMLTKPLLASTYSLGLFFIGRWLDSLNFIVQKSESLAFIKFNTIIQHSLPNLEKFNWRTYVLIKDQVSLNEVATATLYAFGWTGTFIFAAALIFRKKDFV